MDKKFLIFKRDFVPVYIKLYEKSKDILKERVEKAYQLLKECRVCPRNCGVNRLDNEKAFCRTGRYAEVSSYFLHFGEEECIRGRSGSGTIFFAFCNLRCVFCQNYDISWVGEGAVSLQPQELAKIMIYLQNKGAHNINLVTPEHVVPQVIESIIPAIDMGLKIPIVYNTSAYDSLDSIKLLKDIIDIYMPDFKFWDNNLSRRFLFTEDYSDIARNSIKEMHAQVGDLKFNENGIAVRGILLRHLVMPNCIEDSKKILEFTAKNISVHTFINIMDQYHPAGRVIYIPEKYKDIARRITTYEFDAVVNFARSLGLYRIYI